MAVEARAWITGEYPNQKINFELPSGPKGDPGLDGSNVLPTNDAVAQAIETEGPTKTALSDAIVQGGVPVRGVAGKQHKVVAGVIRNWNDGQGWRLIVDGTHDSLNVDAVSATTAGGIKVNYASMGATRVVSFVANTDETLSSAGLTVGSSVATNEATLFLSQVIPEYAVYVYYDGTKWVSSTQFNATWDSVNSRVVLTHAAFPPSILSPTLDRISVSSRGGPYVAQLSSDSGYASSTTVAIEFRDWTGQKVTTPDAGMRAYVQHGGGFAGGYKAEVDHLAVNNTNYPGGNVWFMGVFEV